MSKTPIRIAAPPWIKLLLGISVLLAGCATTKDDVLPDNLPKMRDIYRQHYERLGEHRLEGVREELQRGPGDGEKELHGYVRQAHNEIRALFPLLPNPVLVMFVDPHLAGAEGLPVPAYTTSFRMYERDEYALPGEAPGRAER